MQAPALGAPSGHVEASSVVSAAPRFAAGPVQVNAYAPIEADRRPDSDGSPTDSIAEKLTDRSATTEMPAEMLTPKEQAGSAQRSAHGEIRAREDQARDGGAEVEA